ncbi:MAG: DUF2461 domain-containing protein [Acidimicrobiia bacterium]|nr:DUF2461 domain-containing protein [Acidimicrobiia bacterium]
MAKRHFTPALFTFLKDLDANNEREWFHEHKDRYLNSVQEPAMEFIIDFEPKLQQISPHFTAEAKTVGGSLFRIQRDTRFAKDKTPYKQNTGMQFRHESGKDAHAPGFYLHIQPGECYAGVGLWRPESKVAYQIREHIAEHPTEWKKATQGKRFTDVWTLGGDSLSRPPKGFDADHPLIEDLKRKDFIASTRLSQKQITSEGFLDEYTKLNKRAAPFMEFLCRAVGVPF